MSMLFTPPVLHGPLDPRYIIAHAALPGSPEKLFGNRTAASQLIHQLRAPQGFWGSLIASRAEYDLRYLRASAEELVADLLASKRFQAYALPNEAELEAFNNYNHFDSA